MIQTETPAAYAARLARLHACGVGEGVHHHMRFVDDPHYGPLPEMIADRADGKEQWVRNYQISALVLEAQLLRTLARCPAVFYQQQGTLIHIVDETDRNHTVYIGGKITDAANAVCEWVEREPAP